MACACGKHRDEEAKPVEAVRVREVKDDGGEILPTTQCIACSQKHADEAWIQFNEYGYSNENRRSVRGNLRAIVLHTFKEWKEIADLARKCALLVQEAKDDEARPLMCKMCELIDEAFYEANPDVKRRLLELASGGVSDPEEKYDVIIPLGVGSRSNNDELRILLRSIEKNLTGIGRVILATEHCPDWINTENMIVANIADPYNHNKDGCLFHKTLSVIRDYSVGKFVWCSDDNAFMQRIDASDISIIHNHRDNSVFYQPPDSTWRNRVRHTLEWAKERGANLPHNFECHCPQTFDGRELLKGMEGVDYVTQPGLTIYTTWRVVTGTWKVSSDQRDFKLTFENECTEAIRNSTDQDLCSKPFIGYSDAGFLYGLRERLFNLFPNKSKYEL